MIHAYTDGATYRTKPGPMSWAVVYVDRNNIIREEIGALYAGTNNRAELLGVIWALEHEVSESLTIFTDSILTLNIATGIWHARTNVDLWSRFDIALEKRTRRGLTTNFQHVKGHHTNKYNKRADHLARVSAAQAAACLEEKNIGQD